MPIELEDPFLKEGPIHRYFMNSGRERCSLMGAILSEHCSFRGTIFNEFGVTRILIKKKINN